MDEPSEALVARVQELTAQLDEVSDFQARAIADELVASVVQLYGAGLERIFAEVDEETRDRLAQDGVVASLMLIHGLYPVDLETRVREALASVRPYLESHGGDVEIVSVEDGVARLRLIGHCKGCPASEATLELAIEKALQDTAPDLEGLEVEGVREPAANGSVALPIVHSGNGHRNGAPPAWSDLVSEAPSPGSTAAMVVSGTDLLVANVGGTLLAYRNACGSCGARLDAAPMAPDGTLTCAACAGRFELRRAGRSPDDEHAQVVPVPLLRGEGHVRVAVG